MRQSFRGIAALFADRRGVTALEYGIVAGWLAFVVIVAFVSLGSDIGLLIGSVTKSI